MATWPTEATSRAEAVSDQFRTALRASAETLATRDGSTIITDANVNEAAKDIMRGAQERSIPSAILRAILEALGGGGVGAAIALYYDPNHNQTLVVFLLVAGIVMFVSAKVIEHLTTL